LSKRQGRTSRFHQGINIVDLALAKEATLNPSCFHQGINIVDLALAKEATLNPSYFHQESTSSI
jgi:hypothetical protein